MEVWQLIINNGGVVYINNGGVVYVNNEVVAYINNEVWCILIMRCGIY